MPEATPTRVPVQDFRRDLKTYLEQVEHGNVVHVTRHGHVIAECRSPGDIHRAAQAEDQKP